jgi:hypothetical protein
MRGVIKQRVESLDVRLFDFVESQTSAKDRRSLLALHAAVAAGGPFTYLELGSFRGGSLQAVVADPRCERIVSIDPRPQATLDEGGATNIYADNSTQGMLENLTPIPDAEIGKIQTVEAESREIDPESLPAIDFCFIDGEHTNDAALRDARLCIRALRGGKGVIAFHDRGLTSKAIRQFVREVPGPRVAFPLPDVLYVVEIGSSRLLDTPWVREALGRQGVIWKRLNNPRWGLWPSTVETRLDDMRKRSAALWLRRG